MSADRARASAAVFTAANSVNALYKQQSAGATSFVGRLLPLQGGGFRHTALRRSVHDATGMVVQMHFPCVGGFTAVRASDARTLSISRSTAKDGEPEAACIGRMRVTE